MFPLGPLIQPLSAQRPYCMMFQFSARYASPEALPCTCYGVFRPQRTQIARLSGNPNRATVNGSTSISNHSVRTMFKQLGMFLYLPGTPEDTRCYLVLQVHDPQPFYPRSTIRFQLHVSEFPTKLFSSCAQHFIIHFLLGFQTSQDSVLEALKDTIGKAPSLYLAAWTTSTSQDSMDILLHFLGIYFS